MTTSRTTTTATPARSLDAILLDRRSQVFLPRTTATEDVPAPDIDAGVTLLACELLDRGWLLDANLHRALTSLSTAELHAAGRALLADIDEALGAHRTHTPLFRNFPDSVPSDTIELYVKRVLAFIFQAPEQPCVLCGTESEIHALRPCAHLVCGACFDGRDYHGCPICNRAIDLDDPFLRPSKQRPASTRFTLPQRARVLHLGGATVERDAAAGSEVTRLLERTAALSPQDADDLLGLLAALAETALAHLPEQIPARQTKALVLNWALSNSTAEKRPHTEALLKQHLTTATDILRMLSLRSGGDADLLQLPARWSSMSRHLRRTILNILDGLDPRNAIQDMRRYRASWLLIGHDLHPFQHAARHPNAALLFADLRKSTLRADQLGDIVRHHAIVTPGGDATHTRVHLSTWTHQTEELLRAGSVDAAAAHLAARPGEFLRRLDHILRLADTDEQRANVLKHLEPATRTASPAVLLSALGAMRTRAATKTADGARVFFPKGGAQKTYLSDDTRQPIPHTTAKQAVTILTHEAVRRATAADPADVAVIDAELEHVIAPFTERTSSRALVTLTRGTSLALPGDQTVRLFLHWMEAERRADLDLSVAMFDKNWNSIGQCDYTHLRYEGTAAVHSGDFTSAPPPNGASEFVDLDLEQLHASGVRYAVAVCFSFNGVPFDQLAEAFAGVMARDEPGNIGEVFDPRTVEQRFDLTANAKTSVPLLIDVRERRLHWLDVIQGVNGTYHSIARHNNELRTLAQELTAMFASGARITLGEIARWNAAGRASTVLVRHQDQTVTGYRARAGEKVIDFAARIGTPDHDHVTDDTPDQAQLAYLLRGDIQLPDKTQAYALHPGSLNASRVELLTAADVVTRLA